MPAICRVLPRYSLLCPHIRGAAVADKKNLRHWISPSRNAAIRRRMPHYARFEKRTNLRLNITKWANGGKSRHIEAVIRSKNVVKRGVCYYSDKPLKMAVTNKHYFRHFYGSGQS